MTTRYVNLATGSDAADGLSRANAKKTFNSSSAGWVAGDIVYVAGTSSTADSHPALSKTIDNLTIMQDPDQAQAIWDGASVAATWASIGGGVYTKAIASGIGAGAMPAVTMNWRTSTNSRGSHYGTLKRLASAAAVVTAAGLAGTEGDFYYESVATGLITAYFGGADPNSHTIDYVPRNSEIALDLTGTGNVVDGIHFYRWHNDGQGACVWLKDGTGSSTIRNCRSWDCGPHAFICSGQAALMANATIANCTSDGAKADGSHFTLFQNDGFGNCTGTISSCTVERHSHYNIDQTETAGCTQTGFYSHSDAGTPFASVVYEGCNTYDQVVVDAPIASSGNASAPGTATNPTTFKVRALQCNFQNMSRIVHSNHMAMDRCILGLQRAGSSDKCRYGGIGCLTLFPNAVTACYSACVIVLDGSSDDVNSLVLLVGCVNSSATYYVNCTIVDIKSTASGSGDNIIHFTSATNDTALQKFYGCILTYKNNTADQQIMVYSEGSVSMTLSDNAYGLFPDGIAVAAGTIQGAGNPASLTPAGCSDANAVDLDAYPLDANYKVLTTSTLFGRKRATSTIVPASLINGPYDGSFGAYGYSATNSSRVGRVARAGRVSRI